MASRKILNGALIATLILIAGAVWWFVTPHDDASAESSEQTVRTASVTKTTVSSTIAAQGNIEAGKTRTVDFEVSGDIEEIDVVVGDTVSKGDVLATLTSDSVQDSIDAAQETYEEAADEVASAKKSLTSAQSDLTDAKTDYTTAVTEQKAAEKAAAAAEKAAAKEAAATAKNEQSTQTTTGGDSSVQQTTTSTSESSTQSSTQSGSGTSVSSAKQQVSSAQSKVESAQSALTKANKSLAKAAEALEEAKALSDYTTLTAPMAGLITAINGEVGDSVSSGSSSASGGGSTGDGSGSSSGASSSGFITISSTKSMVINASFDEADASALAVGQQATVTFPAVEGVELTGEVTHIDPVGTSSGSVVTFGATVTLTDVPASIRIGQTASLTVTTASAEDALAALSRAVTVTETSEDGTATGTVTLVSDDGTQTVTDVVLGVQGDAMTEIISGVAEGDNLLISVDTAVGETTSNQDSTGTGGFPGGSNFPSGGNAPSGGFPGGNGGGGRG